MTGLPCAVALVAASFTPVSYTHLDVYKRQRYFRELLQRIRDIRSSERNFYQQVTDIYATATDYEMCIRDRC